MLIKLVSFLLPLYSIKFTLGIEWALYKVLPLLFLPAVLLLKRRLVFQLRLKRVFLLALLLLSYMFLITVLRYQISIDQEILNTSIKNINQGPFNYMASQYMFWVLPILMIFVLQIFRFDENKSSSYLNYFLYGLLFSCFFGISQLIIYSLLGVGISSSFEVSLNRLGGLSGEPRHLGSFIVLAIIFCSLKWSNGCKIMNTGRGWMFFLIGALLLTTSSSVFAGYLIFIFLSVCNNIIRFRLSKKGASAGVSLFAFIVILILFTDFEYNIVKRISSVESLLYYLPKDFGIILFLLSDFNFLFFGCGAGGVDMLLSSQLWTLPDYILRAPIYSDSDLGIQVVHIAASGALIRFASDFGLFGLALLFYFIFSVINLSSLNQNSKTNLKLASFTFFTLSTMSFVIFLYGIFVLACTRLENKSNLNSRSILKL
jgi:hypothetical protein